MHKNNLEKITSAPLVLDGSTGEGGGQILRTGLALAMVTGRPLHITRIRAGRPKPGLMRQHLACVQAAVAVCGGQAEGAELNSQTLVFTPGEVRAGDYRFQIATAGSCLLVLQTVLPALMLADGPSKVELAGGTHNPMAPPFDFLERAFVPLVRRLGVGLELQLQRRGFYPAGGGEVVAHITPAVGSLAPFDLLARGVLKDVLVEGVCAAVPKSVATREFDELARLTGWERRAMTLLPARQEEGPGNILLATLHYEHVTELVSSLGAHGLSSEAVARNLCQELRDYQKKPDAAVGAHLADQLVLLLALAVWQSGERASFSCSEVTEHLRSNIAVIQQFLPVRIAIETASAPVVRIVAV